MDFKEKEIQVCIQIILESKSYLPESLKETKDCIGTISEKFNLDRSMGNNNTWVLVRIVPNLFALFKLSVILPYLTEQTQQIRPHSGEVWALFCNIDQINEF